MSKYLVLRILDSQSVSLPSTLVYGSVELRPYDSDSECEIEVLKESASRNRVNFEQYLCSARIATIVESGDIDEAISLSDDLFANILDLKSVEFAISSIKTSDIGFIKNIDTGSVQPIVRGGFNPTISFLVKQGDTHCFDVVHHILSLDSELSKRYSRSLHWVRNGKHETNNQIKIIFYWFAIEALLKESEKDSISGVIRWFLGFPNGKRRNDISPFFLERISNNTSYDYWSKELVTVIDKIRDFRNYSVHSGFRSFDFTKKELELYSQLMVFGASRCQAAVQYALLNGIETVLEFKEHISLVFEENVTINDVHNNIIYSLDRIRFA